METSMHQTIPSGNQAIPPTDPTVPSTRYYKLSFSGKGSEYFSIMIVNWLLTLITLGFYYPWARAKRLQYVHAQTKLDHDRFHFSGTGKEMFAGFLKVILFYVCMVALFLFITYTLESPNWAILTLYFMLITLIPFAIHGALRYRMSRTSYRGIRFGYRGDRSELIRNFYKWLLLTLVTFGIYGAWFAMNLRRYLHKNIRYGEASFSFDGSGIDYLILNIKGYVLTILTLGIYSFWWMADLIKFYFNHLKASKDDTNLYFNSTVTGGGLFKLLVGNFFLIIFTLGLGKAWADMRTQHYLTEHMQLAGDLDLESMHQTEEEYTNAFGEDAMDFFDIDLA